MLTTRMFGLIVVIGLAVGGWAGARGAGAATGSGVRVPPRRAAFGPSPSPVRMCRNPSCSRAGSPAVHFKEGDAVKTGQALVQQDDAAEQVLLAQLKAQSEDMTQIRASEASLAQKKVDLQKLEKAAASNAATALEVEHAKLDVTIAQLSLELARFEHEQAGRKYQEQKVRVENMLLKSPIDGYIEKIEVEVGESVNTTDRRDSRGAGRSPVDRYPGPAGAGRRPEGGHDRAGGVGRVREKGPDRGGTYHLRRRGRGCRQRHVKGPDRSAE